MNVQTKTMVRYLNKGIRYNVIASIGVVILFLIAQFMDQLPWEDSSLDNAVATISEWKLEKDTVITEDFVRQKVYGKALFRTIRVVRTKNVDALGHFRLKGTSGVGERAVAFIIDEKEKKIYTKRVGQKIGLIYEIVEIDSKSNSVQVDDGKTVETLRH